MAWSCRVMACVAALGVSVGVVAMLHAQPSPTLTLYAAQHRQVVEQLTDAFTKQTGIKVRTRYGEAPELASAIIKEGANAPADVFFTENSPELTLLDEKSLLAKVDDATLAKVPAAYDAADGNWLGVFARENVLVFNPKLIDDKALPATLLDLAKPAWKGKIAIAPTDADFLPLVTAVQAMHGRAAALDWLRGLKANAQLFDDDEAVVAAVDRGAVATGIVNNYYWARLHEEQGPIKTASRVHHFSKGDVGGLINVSGAAVLRSSHAPAAAQRFLLFLVAKDTQRAVAQGNVSFEYPLASGVAASKVLVPFEQLQPPSLTMRQLGDDQDAAVLLKEAGLI